MGRYLTRQYAAVTWPAAVRLARLDSTPIDEIRYSAAAMLIHRTDWWAWWSDHQLTTAIGIPEELQPQGLSSDAEALISDVLFSDLPAPQCGWLMLAQVRRILSCEMLSMSLARGSTQPATWEQLTVELEASQPGILYRCWVRYEEGYSCEIRTEPPVGL
ncbi:MAG: hypothetical protein F6K19_23185 [Cyanothece sp. SIO1E1]|nr:hypothetical protein [Cyanothece sp. SIO1E1]